MPESEEDEDTTYHFTVEVEDNREPQYSAADSFIYNFVKTIHYWVTAFVALFLVGGLLTLIGIL